METGVERLLHMYSLCSVRYKQKSVIARAVLRIFAAGLKGIPVQQEFRFNEVWYSKVRL